MIYNLTYYCLLNAITGGIEAAESAGYTPNIIPEPNATVVAMVIAFKDMAVSNP